MSLVLDRVVLGLFTGLTYALLAVGLVLVYRSSRFVNFAHGSIGVFGAAVLGRLVTGQGLPYWLAFPAAMLVAAGVGAGIEAGVVRRLRRRPRVVGMIATLGLSQFILVVALLVNRQGVSGATFPRPPGLPSFTIGRTPVGPAFTAMLILTPVLLVALALFLKRTRYGLAIRAAADQPDAATLDGVPAARMATIAWAIAGGVAAFSAILVTPTQGAQSIDSLGPDLLLKGLAGAVIARLSSIPIAFAASLGIGVLEQFLLAHAGGTGLVQVVLGATILIALLRQPRLSRRDADERGWTRGGAAPLSGPWPVRHLGLLVAGAGFAVAAALAYVVDNETASALTTIAGFTLVGLSVLVVTGVAGELSLGQFAFAGIGGAVSVRVGADTGNFFLGVVCGAAAAALAAALVGVPALRLRGLALAVTTLAFALATTSYLLRRDWLLGSGVPSPKPDWAGYTLDVAADYYLFALMMLGIGLWLTANLRRGGFGRLLTALRDNEEAARALTVPAPLRKLQAYAVAGALAGLGGAVIGHGQSQLTVNSFPAAASIDVVALTVVGGIALLGGPLLGALAIVGIPAFVPLGIPGQAALTLGWLLVVILLPGGLGGLLVKARDLLAARFVRPAAASAAASGPAVPAPAGAAPAAVNGRHAAPAIALPPRTTPAPAPGTPLLSVRGVARSYGGVTAVAGVSLDVAAGEVVGIIGPNGAGKTTFFEILAGFVRPDGGTVGFAGRDVTRSSPERRARLGLVRSFQDARLFATMTVLETVMTAGERTAPSRLVVSALGAGLAERRKAARAAELVDLMGLSAVAHTQVGALSTGTRRMVELACLLALEPALLLLDEPSSGVSQADGVALGDLLLRIHRELGTTLLIIEHDLPLLSRLAGRLVAMDRGRVIADGAPDAVRAHPDVVRAYLGTDDAAVHRSGPVTAADPQMRSSR
ncbi:ATP-binding cassette domain-containing protein [Dactylosporangium sp. AC04546]|uniref:ABC transporter permease subunit n=1 Tax=Dactylosporangium sp. AC04546 TaxID=2862460 RepID=UPI001EDDE396|nr:ATP-binding cassette domain-containing protein [Dactylosporangium sp. AC04546]WVK81485.1 ATP-binding cassette domain-containing protein [Dactylosporangium sp. AC04546]